MAFNPDTTTTLIQSSLWCPAAVLSLSAEHWCSWAAAASPLLCGAHPQAEERGSEKNCPSLGMLTAEHDTSELHDGRQPKWEMLPYAFCKKKNYRVRPGALAHRCCLLSPELGHVTQCIQHIVCHPFHKCDNSALRFFFHFPHRSID